VGLPLATKLNLHINISSARFPTVMMKEKDLPQRNGCDGCGVGLSGRDGDDLRCACGNLIARLVAGRLELKCRRCKRTITLPISSTADPSTV
jgi:phage FluMu protein Com